MDIRDLDSLVSGSGIWVCFYFIVEGVDVVVVLEEVRLSGKEFSCIILSKILGVSWGVTEL